MEISPSFLARVDGFDWDEHNARKVLEKHAVYPAECEELFLREPRLLPDDAHSRPEERLVAFGQTATGRRLAVVIALRGSRIRVVTAREQSRRERRELGDVREAEAHAEVCRRGRRTGVLVHA